MSSTHISVPSCEALPPPARPPVCAIDMPILIGPSCARASEPLPSAATAAAPPRNVLRFIDLPCSRYPGCSPAVIAGKPTRCLGISTRLAGLRERPLNQLLHGSRVVPNDKNPQALPTDIAVWFEKPDYFCWIGGAVFSAGAG